MGRLLVWLAVLGVLTATDPSARAEQPPAPEDVRALLDRVDRQEARIRDLEARAGDWDRVVRALPEVAPVDQSGLAQPVSVGGWSAGEPAEDLAGRVAELEAALESVREEDAAAKKQAAGRPSVKVGGRIHLDAALFGQNDTSKLQAGNFQNGAEFRRTRIKVYGEAFRVTKYQVEFDFASAINVRNADDRGTSAVQETAFKDVYIGVTELPLLGEVRAGHFKTPFSLEQYGSDNHIPFIERALPIDGQEVEGRRLGILAFDHNWAETFTWATGVFVTDANERPPIFRNDGGGYALVTRYTYLPWYDEAAEGRGLLHLGIAYAFADVADGDAVRFGSRPEAHMAGRIVDTGNLWDVPNEQTLGLEASLVQGPFSLRAEYLSFWVDRTANVDSRFHGGYVFVSYFLTGENRDYDRTKGVFGRVKPFENFFRICDEDGCLRTGPGAWEVLYRVSYLDVNSGAVNGGSATDHTAGLTWYLNPYVKLMVNYVYSQTTDHPDAAGLGSVNAFLTRFQVDF